MNYSTYIKGPSWVDVDKALYRLADVCDVSIIYMSTDRGIFRKTTHFTLEGKADAIENFCKSLKYIVNRYNE